jgi:hypothetical protein
MTTHRTRALVFFGLDERLVDVLLGHVFSSGCVPERCLVFGKDMPLLGALVSQWGGTLDVMIVHMPRPDATMLEAATLVMAREGIAPEMVVWVHTAGLPFDAPCGMHTAVCAKAQEAELGLALTALLA